MTSSDESAWEPWQHAYRHGVLLLVPPPPVRESVDELRARYDPRSAAICCAHISVSDPLSSAMTASLANHVRQALQRVRPFELHYGDVTASPERAGVTYRIWPQEPIDHLKQTLHQTALFTTQPHSRRSIPAHMTIAEFISIERSLELRDQLRGRAPSGSFLCDRLEHLVPDQDFRFRPSGTFLLGAW